MKLLLFHWIMIFFVLSGGIFLGACTSTPPFPSDSELMDRLAVDQDKFEALIADTGNQNLQKKLGILSVSVRSEQTPEYFLTVWQKDLIGPGGYAKGYYYSEITPSLLVDNTDPVYTDRPTEEIEVFRHIQGPWYIFYSASN